MRTLRNNINRRQPVREAINNVAYAISGASMIATEIAEIALDELRTYRYERQAEIDAEIQAEEATYTNIEES